MHAAAGAGITGSNVMTSDNSKPNGRAKGGSNEDRKPWMTALETRFAEAAPTLGASRQRLSLLTLHCLHCRRRKGCRSMRDPFAWLESIVPRAHLAWRDLFPIPPLA